MGNLHWVCVHVGGHIAELLSQVVHDYLPNFHLALTTWQYVSDQTDYNPPLQWEFIIFKVAKMCIYGRHIIGKIL